MLVPELPYASLFSDRGGNYSGNVIKELDSTTHLIDIFAHILGPNYGTSNDRAFYLDHPSF